MITYIIALGDFTHIIAGSVEAIYMVLIGESSFWDAFGGFFIPTLLGNVAGGTILFALISYAQVREELEG
jgi:formate/nitrite transporter FocA (FNT family)